MTDNTLSKALRMYAQFVREANLMASPARETFLTGLSLQMEEAANTFEKDPEQEMKDNEEFYNVK